MTFQLMIVVGARPNFMKVVPLIGEINRRHDLDLFLVHTGQHYDSNLSDSFFKDLNIPSPDVNLNVGSGGHGEQTAKAMLGLEPLMLDLAPDMVLVIGDVNSTLAAALTSVKLHIPVAHVEAGLRSFNMKMPEEVNRVLTDHVSDILFATEPVALENLEREGIDSERVHLVGNVMIDTLIQIMPLINRGDLAERMSLEKKRYGVLTIHRPSNVDSKESILKVLSIIREAVRRCPVVFPVHPRTMNSIVEFGLESEFRSLDNLGIVEPLGYIDFMSIVLNASYVMTDSGGIQAETTWLGIPCITLRNATEHIITLKEGTNRLIGLDVDMISAGLDWAEEFNKLNYSPPKLWDGKTAKRIVDVICEYFL